MTETYLQRKLFGRLKRQSTQTSISSVQTQSANNRESPTCTSSTSTPQLNHLIRQSSDESAGNNEATQTSNPKSRLRSATRAIFFFKRTTNSTHRRANGQMLRQDTNDSSNSQQSQHPSNQTADSQLAGSVSSQTPQFIVPKMNALKLPLVCLIKSIDGELMREVFVHRYELGQYLIESLQVSLGINDSKYFGLKLAKSVDDQEDLRNSWLDLSESVCKQLKGKSIGLQQSAFGASARSIEFYLRIKFYPPNLGRVQDPFLRHYLWLQLRRDLRLGKLTSSMNNLSQLMACVLQYEFGDCRAELLERLPDLNILPNQDLIEEQAVELWRTRLIGAKRHQAQMQFLRAAVILETYGFDYYPVRDHQRQRAYLLGFNYAGIKTIRNGRIVHHFRWHSLSKITNERRMIIFHIYPTENSKRKQILGFKCLSNEVCQNLYMRLLEQKYFFTVDLAYFDKSIRRPSCLYTTPTSLLDWTASSEDLATHPLEMDAEMGQMSAGRSSNEHSASSSPDQSANLGPSASSSVELDRDQAQSVEKDHWLQTMAARRTAIAAERDQQASRNQVLAKSTLTQDRDDPQVGLWFKTLTYLGADDTYLGLSRVVGSLFASPTASADSAQIGAGFVSAIRFCLVLLAMHIALTITDSLTRNLIELFTLSSSKSSNPLIGERAEVALNL